MSEIKQLHNLNDQEILNLQQLVLHPGWAALNKLLVFQVEQENRLFLSREHKTQEEIVLGYKDVRGVNKAVGQVLSTIKLLVQGDEVANVEGEEVSDPYGFRQLQ